MIGDLGNDWTGLDDLVALAQDDTGRARRGFSYDHDSREMSEIAADIDTLLSPPQHAIFARHSLALSPCPPDAQPDFQIGGAPLVTSETEWPAASDGNPLYYFGAVDLSALHAGLTYAERFVLPEMPVSGCLLIFLNMFATSDDKFHEVIDHAPKHLAAHSPCDLPKELRSLRNGSEYVDLSCLSNCGRMFLRSDHVLRPMIQKSVFRAPPLGAFQSKRLSALMNDLLNAASRPLSLKFPSGLAREMIDICHGLAQEELALWRNSGVADKTIRPMENV